MKRYLHFALFILIFIMACGSIPAVSPTATATFEPTFTPLPIKSPTPLPTSTPNIEATEAAQATQTADDMVVDLEKIFGDTDIPYQDGYLAWKYDDPINVSMTGPESKVTRLDDRLSLANFIIKSDVTWSATGIIICGVTFRSEEDLILGRQYQFLFLRLSGLPAWEIALYDFGNFKNSITKTQFSSALLQANNATNEFVLAAYDEQFTLYINGIRQGRYFDHSKQSTEGIFAFLGSQDSGKGSCKYENSWIWSLDPPGNGPTTWIDDDLLKMM